MKKREKALFYLGMVIFGIIPCILLLVCFNLYKTGEKETHTYTMGGYAVNSVTIETDDWNVWRVRGYDLIDNEYYIVTFDDNGTINVEDDIILNIEKANPPKN